MAPAANKEPAFRFTAAIIVALLTAVLLIKPWEKNKNDRVKEGWEPIAAKVSNECHINPPLTARQVQDKFNALIKLREV